MKGEWEIFCPTAENGRQPEQERFFLTTPACKWIFYYSSWFFGIERSYQGSPKYVATYKAEERTVYLRSEAKPSITVLSSHLRPKLKLSQCNVLLCGQKTLQRCREARWVQGLMGNNHPWAQLHYENDSFSWNCR